MTIKLACFDPGKTTGIAELELIENKVVIIRELSQVIDFEGYVKSSNRYESISDLFRIEKDLEGDDLEDAMERTSISLNDASDMELELLGREFNVDLSEFYSELAA